MPKTVDFPGQTALIDTADLPPGAVVTAPEQSEDGVQYAVYSEWAEAARPYWLDRAIQPGAFTAFEVFASAPKAIREPANPHWQGRLTVELHDEEVIDYARDEHGTERWSKSRRPKTAKSGVRVWVGAATKAASS